MRFLPQRVALAALLLALVPHAQARNWNLIDVLQVARRHHPSVKLRQSELQVANTELQTARWGRYPSLSTEIQAAKGANQSLARVQQPLWTGGRLSGQIAQAEANVGASTANVSEAQQSIVLDAGQAFFESLRFMARLEAAQANVVEHQRLLDVIERRVKAEVSPATDATQASARLQQAISERLQFERQLEALRSSLQQLVGAPVETLTMPRAVALSDWSLDRWQEAAWAHSPQRQRLQAQIEAAQAQIDTARSTLKPQVSVGYDLKLGRLTQGEDRGRVFLGVSLQTGAGLSSLSAIDTAVARQQATRDALEQHQRELAQTIRSSWNELGSLSAQLAPARALMGASDEVVESYLRQFQVGRKTWLDVLNAQREMTNARYTLADIEAPLLLAKLRLMVLTGQLQPDNMAQTIHD